MAWFKRFVDSIVLPDGRDLLTLRDAAMWVDGTEFNWSKKERAA